MEPQYTVYKSLLCDFKLFTCIILFILGIIPGVIYTLYKFLYAKNYSIEFYDDKYVVKSGILSKTKSETVFKGIYSVSMKQTLSGRIFHYGSVSADVVGTHDIYIDGVKNPEEFKQYLQTRKVNSSEIKPSVIN